METKETIRQSLETRADDLDRQMDRMADRAAHTSVDAGAHLRSQLSSLRTRLSEVRSRLREKMEADERAEDEALAQLGRALNDMYAEMADLPK